ncbi:MAG TPA: NAD(P)/FAD-dependent oxidoreductase [Solirubrobacteraceae bacterium]|nr:NAD(P)/FAD-dependent oxidoreductase [Solirubrobacteraceae bacterium]
MTRTALVIGGGIAGPATALALQKAGIEPIVYEAHPAHADGVGGFLTLGTNGIEALRVLDVDERALAAGFPTPTITLRNSAGRCIGETPTGLATPPSHTLKRADLYAALRDKARARGICVEHGKRLVDARDSGGDVRAVFADGSEAAGDVMVGADGVHSTLRRIVDPGAPAPAYSGLLGTGGYATGVPVEAPAGGFEMIFGARAFFGYVAAPDGEVWWFANVPRRPEPARGELETTSEEWRRQLAALFGDDAGPAIPLLEGTPEIAPAGPIHTLAHLPSWRRGRLAVIGDAAHAPSPTSGQGASLAIEDGVVLAKCLRDLPTAEGLARFEALRRPRVERIVKSAARINSSKAAGPVGARLRDAMLPWILRLTADGKAHRETYGYRIEWESGAA